MSAETIAQKWHDQFLRTDPVDHSRAEAAMKRVYRAAGLAPPERFLWTASPIEAVWAVLVLVGKTDGYNHAVLQDVERRKDGKARAAQARAEVAERLGIAEDQVEGHFGKPFYVAEGASPLGKKLQEDSMGSWMARAEAGDDYLAVHNRGPFKPLHDLEQALHFEGYRFRNGKQQGSLYNQALAAAGDERIAILGGRSAHHRLYGNFAFVECALDEALAEAGKLQPTELQRAMWAAYQACGMWWPCHAGVVFAERPLAAELAVDGARLEWADGFVVGTGSAKARTETRPAAPVTVAAGAAILSATLPRDHAGRIAELRKAGGAMPLLDRYLAGEHEAVWQELVTLGEAARSEAHAADALAVAYETMHRVEQNVRLLTERLKALGYQFVEPGSGGLFGLRKPRSHEPHVPPPADRARLVAELERESGGPIPLSLRAFFEVVGEVNFLGRHDRIAPPDSEILPDPLVVCGVEEATATVDTWDDELRLVAIAPDALHKANVSGGDPYMIAVPSEAADAKVDGEPHDVHFVEYLRIAIRWGAFPGWEQAGPDAPDELDQLRRGLIPF